jgi:hypothetical protein
MDVVVVEKQNQSDWDRFVQESPGVIAWHSYRWADVLAQHYGTEFYPLAVYDGSGICGILPLYRIKTLRSGEALISIPHFVAGGIVAEREDVRRALLDKAIAMGKQLNIKRLAFRQYKVKLAGPLNTDENYYNRELELSPDLDKVWQSISQTNREKILESQAFNLELEYPSADTASFFQLLLHDQHAAGVPCVSKSWVTGLFNTGAYEIALLRLKGELVAGTMVKKFRDTVSYPFTCLRDQSERTVLFAYNLYWQLITRLAKQEIRISHSGRIPITEAAFGYRLGWGGTKYSYYYQYHGYGEKQMEFSTKRGARRELVESVWRKIPVSVAQVLGPVVVKQFP